MADDTQTPSGETVSYEEQFTNVKDTADGGVIIQVDNEQDVKKQSAHFANIIDEVDQFELNEAVNDLLDKIDRDKEAREKRNMRKDCAAPVWAMMLQAALHSPALIKLFIRCWWRRVLIFLHVL